MVLNNESLAGKTIIVGVTGGIAAYKAAELVSQLRKKDAKVQVIMTESAKHFITAATLSTISGNIVKDNLFQNQGTVSHIDLAMEADALVIAPATANIIAKMAHGIADDLLSTTILAMRCPMVIAPAMNDRMYLNAVVQENIDTLEARGVKVVQPESGKLACGTVGPGRLAPIDSILHEIVVNLSESRQFKGIKMLITAGGTREPIDPVRYIGNHSSGKMGFAVASAASRLGAEVLLVHANTDLPIPTGVKHISVTTADEMYQAVLREYQDCDVVVKAAAVADFRPNPQPEKIKKQNQELIITLESTTDILAELGRRKKHQVLVGFAAETNNLMANAVSKIRQKNLDLIVANDVSRPDIGFSSDDNQVTFIYPDGGQESLEKMTKEAVAYQILERVLGMISHKLPSREEE